MIDAKLETYRRSMMLNVKSGLSDTVTAVREEFNTRLSQSENKFEASLNKAVDMTLDHSAKFQ